MGALFTLERSSETTNIFGGGNRRCIGAGLAMLEMKLVLATIVSHFQIALTNNRPIKPIRRGLTIAPPPNLQMVVKSE